MKILIIGGTSFIGAAVVRQLVAMQQHVTVFHRGQTARDLPAAVKHILGDRQALLDYRSEFERLAPDVVLDMIAYTQSDARGVIETFAGIVDRVVGISSQDLYSSRDILWGREVGIIDPTPLTEDSPLRSQLYPYQNLPRPLGIPADYDKILVEQVYMSTSEPVGTILRLPMVYGPNDPLHRFFPYLQRMDEGRPVIVLEAQMAHWQGSYGFVKNVAQAIALAVTNPNAAARVYNVAEPTARSQADFIRAIGKAAGWTGQVVVVPRSALPESWVLPFNVSQDWTIDSTRIRQELGYTEAISSEEAFEQTLEWQRSHPPRARSIEAPELLDDELEKRILQTLAHR